MSLSYSLGWQEIHKELLVRRTGSVHTTVHVSVSAGVRALGVLSGASEERSISVETANLFENALETRRLTASYESADFVGRPVSR